MNIIPAIDLKSGKCVRLTQGRKHDTKVYDVDAVVRAQEFASAGAKLIHVVDLDAAFGEAHTTNRTVLEQILSSVQIAVEFGGGVRTAMDVEQLHDLGVERVVLGTIAAESVETLKELVARFGRFIVVGIDAREGKVMTRGWEHSGNEDAESMARRMAEIGVERIVYTDIAQDGMLSGVNIEQTVAVARSAKINVTASGGVSSLEDLRSLAAIDEPLVDSVIIGKAFYERLFTFEQAVEAVRSINEHSTVC